MTQSVKDEAKFLDTRLDDETAAVLEKWNLVILGAALLHGCRPHPSGHPLAL